MATVKLSDYLAGELAGRGVRHVFSVPGGGAMHLNDSIGHQPGIQVVYNLHEQASAVAAEAYARTRGDLGVAMVTSGPGAVNAITGVLAAWLDSTACLFLSGQAKRADLKGTSGLRQLGSQEVDICALVGPITKYAVTVLDPGRILEHLETALLLARSGRPGPVWLDLPLDVQAALIDPGALVSVREGWQTLDPASGYQLDSDGIAAAATRTAAMIRGAERPVILAGNGIRVAGADGPFRRLVGQLGVPTLTTRLGVDLMAGDDPCNFGIPGMLASRAANFTLQNCDLLVAIGTRLDPALIAYDPAGLAPGARKIMVNIDPPELNRMSTIMEMTVCADAADFIRALGDALGPDRLTCAAWLRRCRDWRDRYPFVTAESAATADATGSISIYRFAEALADELAAGDVFLPGSSGNACEVVLTAFRSKAEQRIFHNKGTGAMGLGLPAAIGACVAAQRRVVCVDGDGGFQFNIQELETLRRLQLPVKLFVINNSGYASIRQSQSRYFGRLTGADSTSDLTLPDIGRVAHGYGIRAFRISRPQEIGRQISEVLATDGPVICEVVVAADEERMPRVQSQLLPDGSVVSKPLEDMWPYLDRAEFQANMLSPQE